MKRLAVARALSATLVVLSGTAGAQQQTPTATLDTDHVQTGQRVLVTGSHWPVGQLVHIKLCGNLATNLSADCDLASGSDAGVGSDGTFSMTLPITRPPTDCPCVVWVTSASAIGEARVPLSIVDVPGSAPEATPLPDIARMISVSDVHVSGGGSWTSWFGAGST